MTDNQTRDQTPEPATLSGRIRAIPVKTKIITAAALLCVAGLGADIVIAAGTGPARPVAAAATSRPTITVSSTPSPHASATVPAPASGVSSSVPGPTTAAPGGDTAPAADPAAPAGDPAAPGPAAGGPGVPGEQGAPAPAAVAPGPAPVVQGPAPAAPAPAAPPAAPVPAPVVQAPAPVNPFIDASGYHRTYAQTLATINAARMAAGVPGFVPYNAATCGSRGYPAQGESLDGAKGGVIQHADTVLMTQGKMGATYRGDTQWPLSYGYLMVYQCS